MDYKTCTHTYDSGRACKSAAAKGREFCGYHLRYRGRLLRMAQNRARHQPFDITLPPLDSLCSIQSALSQVAGDKWLEVGMIRMNHRGVHMDAEDPRTHDLGNVSEVVEHVQEAKKAGKGVISMKLVGEGAFTSREDRQASMRFAFRHAGVNCVTVGYKNRAEVDEAIENVNLAMG